MWAGGPPNPVTPIRVHSRAIVPSGAVGRFILRQHVKRQCGVRRADADGLPGRGRGDPASRDAAGRRGLWRPRSPHSGAYHGYEGFRQWIGQWEEAWGDVDYELQDPIDVGEIIVVIPARITGRGAGSGLRGRLDIRLAMADQRREDGPVPRLPGGGRSARGGQAVVGVGLNDQLFETGDDASRAGVPAADAPLATRMRPRDLGEFVGQGHLLTDGSALRLAIESGEPRSAIFYGPPGTGKTTLARIIAARAEGAFEELSAVNAGRPEVREVIARARERRATGRPTILFVDEIHRFNKAQQDVLLPTSKRATSILIGATTENPFFAINYGAGEPQPDLHVRAAGRDDIKRLLVVRCGDRTRARATSRIYTTTRWSSSPRRAMATRGARSRRWRSAYSPATERPVEFTREVPPRTRFSARPLHYDPTATRTTTRSPRSSRACVAAIRTRRSTGSRGCSKPARTRASSPGGS